MQYSFDHIKYLESETIYIIREVAAQFGHPVLLFSGGKDSIVMSHIARKAFWPAPIPFSLLHIDTGHNFPEAIDFCAKLTEKLGMQMITAYVQETIDKGRVVEETGYYASRNALQKVTLLDAIDKYKIDAAMAGARRDEEKSRSKEHIFSLRDEHGQWDPKNQRPEIWNIFNCRKKPTEHFRVFPMSNWTEMDIWNYILQENIEIPSLYFSHNRDCFIRDGVIYAYSDFIKLKTGEKVQNLHVRFRTIGDMTCTGAILSTAKTVNEIIKEVGATHNAERRSRIDDQRSDNSLEDRKKEGYF